MIVSFPVPSARVPVGGVTAIYSFANGLARRGHEVHVVHFPWMGSGIDRIEDVHWFKFEAGVHQHVCEDLHEAHVPAADFVFSSLAPRRCGLPLSIVQGYGTLPEEISSQAYGAPCPKVCISRWLVDVGRRKGVPSYQLVHVPLGIDHLKYRVLLPLDDRPSQVAFLYNSGYHKGAPFALAALEEVKQRVPELEVCLFASRRPERQLPGWMMFQENPPQDRIVREIYNRSRVFVSSSVQEGFGLSSVEAMACGCALVTTSNGGSEDYAYHGESALVSEPKDIAAMADNIEALFVDEERRVQIARRGYELVQRFDWDRTAELLERFLRRYGADPSRYQN